MGVDDQIGRHTLASKRHVLLSVSNTNRTLLSVTRCKLVSDLGNLGGPHTDLDELQIVVTGGNKDLVHDAAFRASQRRRHVHLGVGLGSLTKFFGLWCQRCRLSDNNIFTGNTNTRSNDTIFVDLIIRSFPHTDCVSTHRLLESFHDRQPDHLLRVGVRPVEETAEETTVDTALIHNDGIFLVVSRVTGDSDNGILSCGQLTESKELH